MFKPKDIVGKWIIYSPKYELFEDSDANLILYGKVHSISEADSSVDEGINYKLEEEFSHPHHFYKDAYESEIIEVYDKLPKLFVLVLF